MRILVIGGTQFVGKHFTEQALARGHELTLFNRGSRPAPTGVQHIAGDRNVDLERLREGEWDAVVDTSGYFPRQVRELAEAVSGRVGHYTFISTISVYADPTVPYLDERGELIRLDNPDTEEVTGNTYGGLKALCEVALEESFAGGKLVMRPGLIVGPDDPTDRFTYWPARIDRGGEILVPVGPDLPVQVIDVRDLASWLVRALEEELTGTYNAVSEADRFSFADMVDAARELAREPGELTWVSERFLLEREVGPFVELPLWIPGGAINLSRIDTRRAHAAGLVTRPIGDTVAAALAWYKDPGRHELRAGLTPARERELLEAWRAR